MTNKMIYSVCAAVATIALICGIAFTSQPVNKVSANTVRTASNVRVLSSAETAGLTAGNIEIARLASLSVNDARSAYFSLTPEGKRNVWRAYLGSINLNGLSQDQEDYLTDVFNRLDSIPFDGTFKNGEAERAKAVKLFGREKAGEYFGRIGVPARMLKARFGPDTMPLSPTPNCECKHNEDFCSSTTIPWHCVEDVGNCNFQTIGCGWLWTGVCNGLCYPGAAN